VLEKMNEKMWKESVNYWEEFMTPFPKSMTIPGESGQNGEVAERIFGKVLMCKELEMDFSNQIRQFCETHEISLKAMFVYAWGSLLGRYHDEAQPFVAVAQGGTKAEMFPVRVTRDEDWEKAIRDTEEQLVQSPKYCNCTVQDMESAAGVDFSEYFRMIHNFVEFHELDNMGADRNAIRAMKGIHAEDTDINLFISYCLYEKNIVIHYTSKGGIMETILHNLHELFLDELRLILDGNPVGFDKTKFISAADSNEEKMYKIQLAQVGLYLKESGVFDGLTVDEIMKLAEYCEYATYLSNDAVVTEESAVSKVYIVGDGKLEESLTAADGMVKSIRILKKGDVFGLESLYRDSRGTHTITAVTQQVKIVAIDKEILTEVLRRKPEGWIALLEKESTVKSRFQYLWTLE
ncbi:MAG: cyclic nucleotide-binding domain-containing protein, partial [Eubacterium sp.]|nr:cyclic nucleotide-binding domain-containing protein [Eubacterium sp.]